MEISNAMSDLLSRVMNIALSDSYTPQIRENKESVTIWLVYAYTLAAQNTVIKLLMLILYVEDNTSMSYEEINA